METMDSATKEKVIKSVTKNITQGDTVEVSIVQHGTTSKVYGVRNKISYSFRMYRFSTRGTHSRCGLTRAQAMYLWKTLVE
jgi:hypothetical protein